MFRKIDDRRRTATISGSEVVVMYDEGWENILDCRIECGTEATAREYLANGWEEYDPNAALKAAGFVWNGFCYAKP